MGSIIKTKAPYIGHGKRTSRFGIDAKQYARIKNRIISPAHKIAIAESNTKRVGNDQTPTLRKFSWQRDFATDENLSVIAALASACGRGNLYDKIGNGALKHQS